MAWQPLEVLTSRDHMHRVEKYTAKVLRGTGAEPLEAVFWAGVDRKLVIRVAMREMKDRMDRVDRMAAHNRREDHLTPQEAVARVPSVCSSPWAYARKCAPVIDHGGTGGTARGRKASDGARPVPGHPGWLQRGG